MLDRTVRECNLEARVRVRQDRGAMDYSRRAMRNVETFRVALEIDPASP